MRLLLQSRPRESTFWSNLFTVLLKFLLSVCALRTLILQLTEETEEKAAGRMPAATLAKAVGSKAGSAVRSAAQASPSGTLHRQAV